MVAEPEKLREVEVEEELEQSKVATEPAHRDCEAVVFFPRSALLQRLLGRFPVGFRDKALEEKFIVRQCLEMRPNIKRIGRLALLPVLVLAVWAILQPLLVESEGLETFRFIILAAHLVIAFLLLLMATCSQKFGETTVLVSCGLFLVAVLMCHPDRAALLTGQGQLDQPLNDSHTVAYVAVAMATFFGFPIRCSRGITFALSAPVLYAALTLPLGQAEDCALMSWHILLLAFVCFLARGGIELRDRREFLRNHYLEVDLSRSYTDLEREKDELTQEKALREMAEFRAGEAEFKADNLFEAKEELPEFCDPGDDTKDEGDRDGKTSPPSSPKYAKRNVLARKEQNMALTEAVFRPLAGEKTLSQLQALDRFAENEGWLMRCEQIDVSENVMLGKGGFGRVMAGRHVHTDVAVKMHDHQSFVGYRILLNELCLLRSLRHPNIVNFYGATVDASTGQLCLIIERIVGLSMRDIFSQGNWHVVDPTSQLRILIGISSALIYLHYSDPAIVHGDLQHGNVVLEANARPRLIDFGASRSQTDSYDDSSKTGTLRWMAPEMAKKGVTPLCSADMFSLGRLLFFVVCGRMPLHGMKKEEMKKLGLGKIAPDHDFRDLPDEGVFFGLCRNLSSRCLALEPNARPQAKEVMHELTGTWSQELQTKGYPTDQPFASQPPNPDLWEVMAESCMSVSV